jgi:hypothetical protein
MKDINIVVINEETCKLYYIDDYIIILCENYKNLFYHDVNKKFILNKVNFLNELKNYINSISTLNSQFTNIYTNVILKEFDFTESMDIVCYGENNNININNSHYLKDIIKKEKKELNVLLDYLKTTFLNYIKEQYSFSKENFEKSLYKFNSDEYNNYIVAQWNYLKADNIIFSAFVQDTE